MSDILKKDINIAMVGISGSGKSSFLSSLNQIFTLSSVNGITILPRNDENQNDFFTIGKLSSFSINDDIGTDRTTIYKLKLKVDSDILCNFNFIDYRGGVLVDMFKPNKSKEEKQEIEKTKEYIKNSDAILVLADSILLSNNTGMSKNKLIGADKINPLFNIFEDNLSKKQMSFLILLTKSDSDAILKEDKLNNYSSLANKALESFNVVYECAKRHVKDNWNFGILPITCIGEGNSITNEVQNNGKEKIYVSKLKENIDPAPKNIDIAILSSIVNALRYKIEEYKDENDKLDKYIKELREEKDNIKILNGSKYKHYVESYLNKSSNKKTNKNQVSKNKINMSGFFYGKKYKEILDEKIEILQKEIKLNNKDIKFIEESIDKILNKVDIDKNLIFSF